MLLTTHYMEEAERLCDRVAIIDHGRVIALGTPADLVASLGAEQVVEFAARRRGSTADDSPRSARRARGPASANGGWIVLRVDAVGDALPALLAALERSGRRLERLTTHQATLEDVFVHLTGRAPARWLSTTRRPRSRPEPARRADPGSRARVRPRAGGGVLGLRLPGAAGAGARDRLPESSPTSYEVGVDRGRGDRGPAGRRRRAVGRGRCRARRPSTRLGRGRRLRDVVVERAGGRVRRAMLFHFDPAGRTAGRPGWPSTTRCSAPSAASDVIRAARRARRRDRAPATSTS